MSDTTTERRFVVRMAEYGNCWLANWSGDPGRTLCLRAAKTWRSKASAQRAANRAHKAYNWRKIGVVEAVEVVTTIRPAPQTDRGEATC